MNLIAKIIFKNFKRWIFIVFFCFISILLTGQSKKVKEATKKKEQQKEEKMKAADAEYNKKLQHQYDIQSKATKKRMKENKKQTDKYYKKKLNRYDRKKR